MDAKEIIDAAWRLPLGQQKQIANWLIWNIDRTEHRAEASERYADILHTAERVTGKRDDPGRRDGDSVFVRTLAAWRMIEEGYTKMDIARAMGKNHSTIVYIDKQRKAAKELPNAFPAHLSSYNKLNLALNDND